MDEKLKTLTPYQRRKLEKLVKVIEGGNVAILDYLFEIEEKVESAIAKAEKEVARLKEVVEPRLEKVLDSIRGKDGESIVGPEGPKGVDGTDYVLTDTDKVEIAKGITVPVVEKVIEHTETVIKEPTFTETKITVENPVTPVEVRDKLETLKEDERLDESAVKGLEKRDTKLSTSIINRAIGIVDSRTSFLINKVSNIETQVMSATANVGAIGGTITGGTTGSVLFVNPTGVIAQDNADFFFDPALNKLQVSGNIVSGNATDGIRLSLSGVVAEIIGIDVNGGAYNPINIRAQNTTQLYLATSGYVGINTLLPNAPLNIKGTGSVTLLRLDNDQYTFSTIMNGESMIIQNGYLGAGWARALLQFQDAVATVYFALGGLGSGQSFTYAWLGPAYNTPWQVWLPNGNVGIGNTNPGALLDLGLAGTTLGVIRLAGNTSGNVSLRPNAIAGSNIVLTLPATTDTLVGKITTDTLTNKTLTDAVNSVVTPTTTSVGYLAIPQNSQSADYTAVLTDSGKHILHPSADTTPRTFTIPANASVAYPIGTAITIINQNAGGVITVAITSDTMRLAGAGTTGSRTLAANGVATAIKITSTEWIISGTGLT